MTLGPLSLGHPYLDRFHGRPKSKLVRIARRYESDVTIRLEGGEPFDAKSLIQLSNLPPPERGATLVVEARGDDAERAIRSVANQLRWMTEAGGVDDDFQPEMRSS